MSGAGKPASKPAHQLFQQDDELRVALETAPLARLLAQEITPAVLEKLSVRISSIDSLDVLTAWIRIERAFGPRPAVMQALRSRNRDLIKQGERDERTTYAVEPNRVPSTRSNVRFVRDDTVRRGGYPPYEQWLDEVEVRDRSSSAAAKVRQLGRARADGGEES